MIPVNPQLMSACCILLGSFPLTAMSQVASFLLQHINNATSTHLTGNYGSGKGGWKGDPKPLRTSGEQIKWVKCSSLKGHGGRQDSKISCLEQEVMGELGESLDRPS